MFKLNLNSYMKVFQIFVNLLNLKTVGELSQMKVFQFNFVRECFLILINLLNLKTELSQYFVGENVINLSLH